MRTKLFALYAAVGLTLLAVGPGVAAAANETSGNDTAVGNQPTEEFDTFGAEVSSFVHELLGDENRTGGIGPAVADFVTANNPGNAPDHAGPPAEDENETDENESDDEGGPPADLFADDDERGPPADAGPPEDRGPGADDSDENETDDENETENETDGDSGPPEDAGPPEDEGSDGDDEETEDDDGGNGNGGGPPEDAGRPDDRGN